MPAPLFFTATFALPQRCALRSLAILSNVPLDSREVRCRTAEKDGIDKTMRIEAPEAVFCIFPLVWRGDRTLTDRQDNLCVLPRWHAAEINQKLAFLYPSHHRRCPGSQSRVEAVERFCIEIDGGRTRF